MNVNPLEAEFLPVGAEGGRQNLAQEAADLGRFLGQLVEQVVAEDDLVGNVQRHECLCGRRAKDGLGRGRIAIDIELGGGGNVARSAGGSPHDDDATYQRGQLGVALKGAGDVGQRAQGNQRDGVGGGADMVADDLFRGVDVLPFGQGQIDAAHAVWSIEPPSFGWQPAIGVGGGADARPARRIERLDNGLHIARGLGGAAVAGDGRDGHHVQMWIEQCPA